MNMVGKAPYKEGTLERNTLEKLPFPHSIVCSSRPQITAWNLPLLWGAGHGSPLFAMFARLRRKIGGFTVPVASRIPNYSPVRAASQSLWQATDLIFLVRDGGCGWVYFEEAKGWRWHITALKERSDNFLTGRRCTVCLRPKAFPHMIVWYTFKAQYKGTCWILFSYLVITTVFSQFRNPNNPGVRIENGKIVKRWPYDALIILCVAYNNILHNWSKHNLYRSVLWYKCTHRYHLLTDMTSRSDFFRLEISVFGKYQCYTNTDYWLEIENISSLKHWKNSVGHI
jgi:hypothetical protein